MIQDDYILSLIERIVQMMARYLRGEVSDAAELDAASQSLVGLPLALIERLDPASLERMLGEAPPAQRAGLGLLLISRGEALVSAADPSGWEQIKKGHQLALDAAAQLRVKPPSLLAAIARAEALLTSGSPGDC